MRNEIAYRRAFWAWFVENASTPGPWGSRTIKREIHEHLLSCGIDPQRSTLPEMGSITEWGNTDNPSVTSPALTVGGWHCNCDTYNSGGLTLFVAGGLSIGEIIFEVIRKADELES
jgi:hypothetical protein